MRAFQRFLFIALSCSLFFGGCSSESASNDKSPTKKVIFGKMELSEGWARPGTRGQNSSVYLTISNGTASIDTLISVNSETAEKAELHESIQNEDGTMSMRPVGIPVIEDGTKLRLAPGGLHIMLVNLKRDLAIGDSVSVALDFANVGKKDILVPVQIQN